MKYFNNNKRKKRNMYNKRKKKVIKIRNDMFCKERDIVLILIYVFSIDFEELDKNDINYIDCNSNNRV